MGSTRKRVVLILAPGFEETEAVAPADVISRSGMEIVLARLEEESVHVTGSHGLVLGSTCSLSNVRAESVDAVVLPGGMPGTRHLCSSKETMDLVRTVQRDNRIIGAICAAPLVLRTAGLLTPGMRITAHPTIRSDLPGIDYLEQPVVVQENLITSRGPGTALLFGLTIVAALKGRQSAERLADSMIVDLPDSVLNEWRCFEDGLQVTRR